MEHRVLNYFLAVVRGGNIAAAAEPLHVSQPTLSRRALDNNEFSGHFGIDIEKLNFVATSNLVINGRKTGMR